MAAVEATTGRGGQGQQQAELRTGRAKRPRAAHGRATGGVGAWPRLSRGSRRVRADVNHWRGRDECVTTLCAYGPGEETAG